MKASTPIRLAPLRARWERQARRIDALSLRERTILFLSLVAVLAALFDTFVLTPQTASAKQRSEARAQQEAELTQLRELFVATSRNTSDPAPALRAQLDAAGAERTRLDEQLHTTATGGAGQDLAVLLQRLLARQPGLVLERLTLLPDTPVAVPQPGASAPTALAGISWQGVELQLQGGYAELQRDIQSIERELPGLRWGELQLSTSGHAEAPRLRAQVFLLKVAP
jgi:MSHA biogenesis protein MshJ